MLETFIAFYAAHLTADFVLQSNWIAANKRNPLAMALHIALALAATIIIAGTLAPLPLLLIAITHFAIDLWKQVFGKGLSGFLIDQGAHLVTLAAIAYTFPATFSAGLWANPGIPAGGAAATFNYLFVLSAAGGYIAAVRMGGFAVGAFIERFGYTPADNDKGLDQGGYYIGLLERSLIYVLVLTGQFAGIGFLVAAKSILRFGITSEDRKTSEYVIIGTLASFGWALVTSLATLAVLERL